MPLRPHVHRVYARSVFFPTLGWNYLLGRVLKKRNWWDFIDEFVIVGAYPFRHDVLGLKTAGVRAVVNTCEEYSGPVREYKANGIEQLRIPTTDFTHPRIDDVRQAVEFVEEHVTKRHGVYIHCKAGRARSATVAMCWLMKYRQMSPEQAQTHLLRKRPHINPRLTIRPVVQEFAKALAGDEDADPRLP